MLEVEKRDETGDMPEETMMTRSVPPSYGIMYNWDGTPHDYSEYPQSIEQFLEKVYAPISVSTMRRDENVRAFFDRGEDLYGVLVAREESSGSRC